MAHESIIFSTQSYADINCKRLSFSFHLHVSKAVHNCNIYLLISLVVKLLHLKILIF